MVEDQVEDTEVLVSRALESTLRKVTREYPLNKHRRVEAELENQISRGLFNELGLELMSADVEMKLSDQDLERVRQLDDLDRAKRFPQQTEHEVELRTKDPAYTFITRAIFNYKVLDASRLPTATLEETEKWLWQRIRAALRREARKYEVNQVQEADWAMKDALDNETFKDHGMEVLSMEIEIDLDERARTHAEELDDLVAEGKLKEKERELRHKAQEFYFNVMRMERFGLLIDLLARETMDPREVIDYLDDKQRENIQDRFRFLKMTDEKDISPDHKMAEHAEKIIDDMGDGLDAGIRIYDRLAAALEEGEKKRSIPVTEEEPTPQPEQQAEVEDEQAEPEKEPPASSQPPEDETPVDVESQEVFDVDESTPEQESEPSEDKPHPEESESEAETKNDEPIEEEPEE
jgi:hypothetical protein